jgi:hypothetical protein
MCYFYRHMQHQIFNIKDEQEFEEVSLRVFKHQFTNNKVYRSFCDLLYIHPSELTKVEQIPFLPIQFFKTHKVISLTETIQEIFTSSGTTESVTSKHYISDLSLYKESYLKGFNHFYGDIENYTILALLPNYLERNGSSLAFMVDDLIQKSNKPKSGFYLNNLKDLSETLTKLDRQGEKVLLIGVSFALLDLVEEFQFNLNNTIIMEDALTIQQPNRTGGINVLDLANYNSCSFIATQDLGKVYQNGSFEIIGRFDSSDIRGCNLMVL